jgi:polar amino acid transport system substrate-binding protein
VPSGSEEDPEERSPPALARTARPTPLARPMTPTRLLAPRATFAGDRPSRILRVLSLLLALLLLLAPPETPAQPQPGKASVIPPRTTVDLDGKRIAVLLGSTHDRFATKAFPRSTVLQYKTFADLILAVKTGKVDAGMMILETVRDMMRTDPEIGMLAENVYSDPVALGLRKGNAELVASVDGFLREIRANGIYDDMVQRWIVERRLDMPAIPNPSPRGVLKVGVASDKGIPWALVRDNRIVGFDIELAERFAAHLGRRLELQDMEFPGLLAAAASGKIDMIASTLAITEERRRQVDFSEPYYEIVGAVMVLAKNLPAAMQGPAGAGSDGQAADGPAPTFLARLADRARANLLQEDRWRLILDGLQVTVLISLLAALFGTLLGAAVCFMRMSRSRALEAIARAYVWLLRGVPVLVLLMIVYYVVFASVDIDPMLVAVLAFGMNFAAYVSEMFRTSIQSVDRGQTEAGVAGGFTRAQTFRFIVMPQAVRNVLPVYKGEFITLVKMTSIVGYIAVQDLTKASDIIRSRTFDAFFPLLVSAVIYLLLAWLLTLALDRLELSVSPRRKAHGGGAAR